MASASASVRAPVPPACPEDLAELEWRTAQLHCPHCGRDFACAGGICDLLPEETRSESSAQGQMRRRYNEIFSDRQDRPWLQPLRRLASALSNGFLYRWAARQVEQFAGGRALTLLDAACGDGTLRYYLARPHAYVGVDFSARLLARADRYHPGSYFLADLYRLPFPAASFDAAVSLEALQFLERPEAALAELRRVLKPEGRLFLSVSNSESVKYRRRGFAPTELQRLDLSGVRALVARHFDIHQLEVRGLWIPTPVLPIHVGIRTAPDRGISHMVVASPSV